MTEPLMFCGIGSPESAPQYGDGAAAGRKGTAMRSAIYSARQAADDGEACGCQLICQTLGDQVPGRRRAPRANDGNGQLVRFLERARDVQERRRVRNRPQV